MSDDPILNALATAAQAPGGSPSPQQAVAPQAAPSADPVVAALQQRAGNPVVNAAPAAQQPTWQDYLTAPIQTLGKLSATGQLSPSDALSAALHHLAKVPVGIAQLGANIDGAEVNALSALRTRARSALGLAPDNDPVSGVVGDGVNALNHGISNWEANYQATTPNTAGAYLGATAGEAAPFLLDAPAKGLTALGDYVGPKIASYLPAGASKLAPAVSRVVGGAAQGAAVGAAQPVTTPPLTLSDLVAGNQPQQGGSFWDEKLNDVGSGAAFGGAFAGATGAASAGARLVADKVQNSPLINPQRYAAGQIATQLGPALPDVTSNLQSAPTYVPGSLPTSAQAGASPDLVMMEKALLNNHEPFAKAFLNRQNSNNAARMQAVGDVAQTPGALQAAIDYRNAITGPMRDFTVTNGNPVPVAPVTDALSGIVNGAQGVQPTIGPAAKSMLDKVNGFTTTTSPDSMMNIPGSATAQPAYLDQLRQSVNDYLSKNAPTGISGTPEQAAMMPVKQTIIDAINKANPGSQVSGGGWGAGLPQYGPTAPSYRDYLSAFAKHSVPINTMELAQALQGKLSTASMNSAGDAQATLPGYRSALAAALRRADYGIDPGAQSTLEGVQDDLQRATISGSVKMPGSDTAFNQGAGSSFLKALGAGSDDNGKMLAAGGAALAATGSPQAAAGVAFAAKKAGGWVTNRVADSLGDLLLNPQKLSDAMQAQIDAQAPTAAGASAGNLTPGQVSALVLALKKRDASPSNSPAR